MDCNRFMKVKLMFIRCTCGGLVMSLYGREPPSAIDVIFFSYINVTDLQYSFISYYMRKYDVI